MLKAISEAFSLLRATRQSPQRAASVLEQLDTRAKQRNETLKQILHEHQDAQRSRTEVTRTPPLPTSSAEPAAEPVVQPAAVPAQTTTQSGSKSGLRDTLDKIDMLLTEVNEMDKKILAMYEPAFKRSVDLAAQHNAQAKAATEEDQVLQKMQHIFENVFSLLFLMYVSWIISDNFWCVVHSLKRIQPHCFRCCSKRTIKPSH
jgi:chromosome segregation ATPase